jgi:hypothetical protein
VADSTGDFLINPHQNPAAYANIILVEENVGEFSDPYSTYPSPPPGIKPYAWAANYQSVAGNTWVSLFNPPGYPLGVINRRSDPYPLFCQQDNQWISIIDSDLYTNHISGTINSAQVTIDIHDSCWIPQRLMGAVFKVNVIAALPGTSYLLQTLIIEDSIISGQMDNIVDSQYVTAFLHRNVLRGAMGNNTGGLLWGTPIPASVTGTSGASWSTFQTYDFTKGENGAASGTSTSPPWNMAHCYIVAFVYSASTNTETPYEVIQAEMIKIE